MITYVQGHLFESSAQVLTNAVNCVGIMGKAIALEFKKRYPAMFCEYVARCTAGQMKIGEPCLWEDDEVQLLMEKHLGSIPDLEVFVYPDRAGASLANTDEDHLISQEPGKFDWSASPATEQTLFGEFGAHEVTP